MVNKPSYDELEDRYLRLLQFYNDITAMRFDFMRDPLTLTELTTSEYRCGYNDATSKYYDIIKRNVKKYQSSKTRTIKEVYGFYS